MTILIELDLEESDWKTERESDLEAEIFGVL